MPHDTVTTPENDFDFHPVAVCFYDQRIADVFIELLSAMRIRSEILNPHHGVPRHRQIITERHFLPLIPLGKEQRCLVVGLDEANESARIFALPQPLTPRTIEVALERFFCGPNS